MNIGVPKLSRVGYITDPSDTLNDLYRYFLISEYSQSNTYRDYITSLSYILRTSATMTEVRDSIVRNFSRMLNRYFDNATVVVESKEVKNTYYITILVSVTAKDGGKYTITRDVTSKNGIIDNLENALDILNNEGL